MTAATDDIDAGTPSRRVSLIPAPAADLVAYAGAAAFVFVTVANPPRFDPGTLDAGLHRWFVWLVSTLPQQRLDTAIAIAGFLCLVPLAAFARDLLGRERLLARLGAAAMAAGALLWVAGNLLQLGGTARPDSWPPTASRSRR